MASCTLEVGDRLVLLAKGGPPEAEFALFDPGEIELASSGPGQVREGGYRTTAGEALGRLEAVGVNVELALEAAAAMIPVVATTYARGATARRVASLLGPGELFDGGVYDFELRRYEGRWMDLPALGLDVELSRATTLMQSLGLVTLLSEVDSHTTVLLTTREYAAERRPGERSHRRVPLDHVFNLKAALQGLAARGRRTPNPEREQGPSAAELSEVLELRAAATADARTKARVASILAAMSVRERPLRGPLAAPELWMIEEQLSAGNASGVAELIEAAERKLGRSPATSYLRARASLVTGRESARTIAERASELAMSMASFAECALLAAEAWAAAGEPRRAAPFARDLIADKGAHAEVRSRAIQLLALSQTSPARPAVAPPPNPPDASESFDLLEPGRPLSRPPSRPPPKTLPPPYDPEESTPTGKPEPRTISDELTLNVHNPSSYPPNHPARPPPGSGPMSAKPPMSPRKMTPPLPFGRNELIASDSTDLPPILAMGGPPASAPAPTGGPIQAPASSPRRPGTQTLGGPPPASPEEIGERPAPSRSQSEPPTLPKGSSVAPRPPITSEPPVRSDRRSAVPPSAESRLRKASWDTGTLMRGASQPPFRSDSPGAHAYIPKAPKVPVGLEGPEPAETLAMPPGLTGAPAPLDTLPSSVIDARVQFTFLARELAREYREERGVALHVDLESVEAMQAYLFERYANGAITTVEEGVDVRKHGALLSEILARTVDAFWVDIAPSDLGYWAMVVPPNTRVWPFGRILRLIAMQHKERDLVAYFLELQARAR